MDGTPPCGGEFPGPAQCKKETAACRMHKRTQLSLGQLQVVREEMPAKGHSKDSRWGGQGETLLMKWKNQSDERHSLKHTLEISPFLCSLLSCVFVLLTWFPSSVLLALPSHLSSCWLLLLYLYQNCLQQQFPSLLLSHPLSWNFGRHHPNRSSLEAVLLRNNSNLMKKVLNSHETSVPLGGLCHQTVKKDIDINICNGPRCLVYLWRH